MLMSQTDKRRNSKIRTSADTRLQPTTRKVKDVKKGCSHDAPTYSQSYASCARVTWVVYVADRPLSWFDGHTRGPGTSRIPSEPSKSLVLSSHRLQWIVMYNIKPAYFWFVDGKILDCSLTLFNRSSFIRTTSFN